MKKLAIYTFLILSLFSCKDDEGPVTYKFWDQDTALIPYHGYDTLKFVRLQMPDSTIFDTVTLIGQGRNYYMHPSDDLGPSTSNEVYDAEAFTIRYFAYTNKREEELDVGVGYRTVHNGTHISLSYKYKWIAGELAGDLYEWNCGTIGDRIINKVLYKNVTKYSPDACYIYNSSYANKPELTCYYNHQYGLLRLIDEDLDMIWELIP